jgi:photosystem II stability/assembly factor-like uncharacterized protein
VVAGNDGIIILSDDGGNTWQRALDDSAFDGEVLLQVRGN